jgi:hypothetical protein
VFDRCLTGLTRPIRSLVLMTVIKNLGRHRRQGPMCEKKESLGVMSNCLGSDVWSPLPRHPKPSSEPMKGVI